MTKTCSNGKDPSVCSGAYVIEDVKDKREIDLTITCGIVRIIKNLIFRKYVSHLKKIYRFHNSLYRRSKNHDCRDNKTQGHRKNNC